jgi:monovalent cation:H+ antiporter-2, CPA2 family
LLLQLVGLFVGIPILFLLTNRLLPMIMRRAAVSQNQEAFCLASLGACLVVAVMAHNLGATLGLGAFLGGLVFAGSPYKHQIRADLTTIKNLALAFFFLAIGMMIRLDYVLRDLPALIVWLAAVLVIKSAIAFGVFKLFRSPWSVAAGAGLAISQVGEFTFVLATLAQQGGIMSEETYQRLAALCVLSMIPAPAMVARSRAFGQWIGRIVANEKPPAHELEEEGGEPVLAGEDTVVAAQNRAIVVGYGPVGRTLCRILMRFGVRPCVIDLKPATVRKLTEIGREAIFGDAARREVLLAAGIMDARYVIITLPDYASRTPVVACARMLNPRIAIYSRARYLSEQRGLEMAGVSHVAYEECEIAVELARQLLSELAVRSERIEKEISRLRSEIAVRSGFTQMIPRLEPTTAIALGMSDTANIALSPTTTAVRIAVPDPEKTPAPHPPDVTKALKTLRTPKPPGGESR